jgi:hypothetical protein
LEVGAEGGFKLDLRQDCDPGKQDCDPGKQELKGAVRTETFGAIIANPEKDSLTATGRWGCVCVLSMVSWGCEVGHKPAGLWWT